MRNLSKGLCKDDRNKCKCLVLIGDKQSRAINDNIKKDSKDIGYSVVTAIACIYF